MSDYYIVDLTRTKVSESVVFWRENGHGYTVDVNDAGTYTYGEALRITSNPDKDNIMVPVEALDASRFVTVMVKSHLEGVLAKLNEQPEQIPLGASS